MAAIAAGWVMTASGLVHPSKKLISIPSTPIADDFEVLYPSDMPSHGILRIQGEPFYVQDRISFGNGGVAEVTKVEYRWGETHCHYRLIEGTPPPKGTQDIISCLRHVT